MGNCLGEFFVTVVVSVAVWISGLGRVTVITVGVAMGVGVASYMNTLTSGSSVRFTTSGFTSTALSSSSAPTKWIVLGIGVPKAKRNVVIDDMPSGGRGRV